MNSWYHWDRKTVLYAIALSVLLLAFSLRVVAPDAMGHLSGHPEIASQTFSGILPGLLFAARFLTGPPSLVICSIAVLGIVRYNSRRIAKKIERSYVPIPDPSCQKLLNAVAGEAGVKDVELLALDSSIPNAFTFSKGSKYYVAVTISMLEILETDELRSVFAHEIAHIKNKDRRIKILGLIVSSQYFYQPFVVLMVRAIFRRREYFADETAAALEHTPLPLMSALLKTDEYLRTFSGSMDLCTPVTSFAFAQRPKTGLRKIFSSSPTIEDRISNLLTLRA